MRLIKSLLLAFALSVGAFAQTGGFLLQFQQGGVNVSGATYKKYALVNFASGCTASVSAGALNITCNGVAGNPGGSAGQLQWNSAGTAFAGITQWTTNGTTTLTAGATAVLALGAMPLSGITFPTASTTGFLRVTTATGALTSGELSGDCTTSGSLSITCTKTSGVAFSGLATAAIPLTVANGGTGTSSTLTGVLRGGSPLTASEISGDCTTSGSNAITCTKTSGTAFSGLATAAIPLTVANGGTGTSSTLTGLMRGSASAMTAAELSGDATTAGSNAVTVKGINGTLLSSLSTGILKNTTTTGVPSIANAADVDALYTGAGKCYLFKGTTPGSNDGCDNPAGSGTVTTTGSPATGELTVFSGSTSITNGNLTGDVTTSNTTATTIASVQGTTITLTAPAAGQMLAITSGPTIVNAFPGVPIDAESSASVTVRGDGAGSDRVSLLQTTNVTTSTAVTVPQAGSTGFDHFFTFAALNTGTVIATYTPTTSTINGNTTMKLVGLVSGHNPEGAFWYSNANGATGNYIGFEILPTDANGLLAAEGFPGLTGDVTASSGSFATTVVKVNGASVPVSATVLGSNGSGQLIAASLQGNGTKAQLSTGTTTTNDCVKFDANGNTVDAGAACAGGTPTFPITVAGTVTSGGIPYFNSTTQESSSGLLAANAIVQGGGAGGAPTTGNGDFTIDATAHTLKSGASGLVDFSSITGVTGFKVPVQPGATAGAAGVIDYDSTNKLTHIATNNVDSIAMATTATSTTTTQAAFASATAGIYTIRAIATGDLPTSGIPNVVYNNTTNTATTAMTLDLSASTVANAFKVPVGAGLTAGANGVIAFDSTAGLTHIRTNGGDSIAAATTSTSTTTTQPLFATATAGVYNPRAIATGDLPNSVVYNNATNTGTSAMTLDMHAATTANALQIPSQAGITSNGTSSIGYDTTGKLTHVPINGADAVVDGLTSTTTTANKVAVSTAVAGVHTYVDFPDAKQIPAANCNNATGGPGWSIGSGGTVTCRAGTNNLGGYISITDTSSTFATFQVVVPEDWDTNTNPYIRFQLASTDATNAHTIIPSIQVACYKGDGSTTDDVAANAAHSLSTVTLNGNANRFWSTSNVQMNSTDVTGCVAGALMQVTVGRATDTATNAEFYSATITFPRLIVVQAN